jgi:hypothetical protein
LTAPEYVQLKAFARIDGALLSLLFVAAFVCYVVGLTSPTYGFLALLTMVLTPVFVVMRLKRFRDDSLSGKMSFLRGWFYVSLMFFYGGLLFALLQYAYLAYIDKGYMVMLITEMLSTPENAEIIKQMGMSDQISETLHMLQTMRPIDFALDMLTSLIMGGMMLGLPIAAVMQRKGEKIKE